MSTDSALSYGTLDTQASTAGIESQAGVTMAMFELNWVGRNDSVHPVRRDDRRSTGRAGERARVAPSVLKKDL
jgi:hypothetical protein